ncbi:MAG: V-type ATPase subunit [Candidatus Brocadia sp.]|nr:V-type ATPase subunit [Candidatus Brocadia sp.]
MKRLRIINEMKKETSQNNWCYLSGRINVLECNLLTQNFFERLLSGNDLTEVLSILNNTTLKTYFTHVKHLYEFEALLDDYYYNRLYEIRSLSPDSIICDFFLIKNDIINLKNFIKAAIQGRSIKKFLRGSINNDSWSDLWQGKAVSVPEVFKESISFLKKIIPQYSQNQTSSYLLMQRKEFKKDSLPFIIDLICDGAYLRYSEYFYNEIQVEIIKQYLQIYKLVKALGVIRRATALSLDTKLLDQYFLEGFDQNHVFRKLAMNTTWTSGEALHEAFVGAYCNTPLRDHHFIQMLSLNLFPKISFQYEVVTDNYLLDIIRPVKYIPFGPERVFGYLCGFTTEVFNLKLVLGGKVQRIENKLLRERLRKTYV